MPTVIGSAVDEILHMSLTGLNLLDMYPADLKALVDDFYQSILRQPCGGLFTRNLESSFGKVKGYQSLLLPIADDAGTICQMVGVITVSGMVEESPGFGHPEDIRSVKLLDMHYLDIGFGAPPQPKVPEDVSAVSFPKYSA